MISPFLHVEVGKEHDPQLLAHRRIGVNGRGHRVDQLDDQLGHGVSRRRLGAEDDGARRNRQVGIFLDPVVQGDDVQDVQQLPLVLVQALDLDIEHGGRIDDLPGALLHQGCQDHFARVLHLAPLLAELRVVDQRLQLAQFGFVGQPAAANLARDQGRQLRIRHGQPHARGHAVGHVEEALRIKLVEIVQRGFLQQLRMQLGNAIDRMAADRRQVRHANILVTVLIDQR